MTLFAHSSDSKRAIPAQDYAVHVSGVVQRAVCAAQAASKYSSADGELLSAVVGIAAEYHDLGKLDPENQNILSGRRNANALPIQHTEAGTVYLMNHLSAGLEAALVRSHHIGLPDYVHEENRSTDALRDERAEVRKHVDESLDRLVIAHNGVRSAVPVLMPTAGIKGNRALFQRIALSCLADGDHTDTSVHYREYCENNDSAVPLRSLERLAKLDSYVASLAGTDERSRLRADVYAACRNAGPLAREHILSCDSPVGTGKTTAVMAYLLALAARRNLRRIFVVLPYTNIIKQSVEVYRKALVLDGENPEQVVAELHHRADYQDMTSRQFTALWKSPIVVTTAVAFFETLASKTPATLRKLHNLPGSAVFLDESHAALPAKYLPLAWQWMKDYGRDWNCHWTLASGSLIRFWEIEEFDSDKPKLSVPEIVPHNLHRTLARYEDERVSYRPSEKTLDSDELVNWIGTLPGPRLVILNTVQSAAAVAALYAKKEGRSKVEHISTALTSNDRNATLNRVRDRLRDNRDTDWSLIATSCVEAGVDLSFKTGVREIASLVSLLQIAGRINRHGKEKRAVVWSIDLREGGPLKKHPMLKESAQVLKEFFNNKVKISPELCTIALQREVRMAGVFVKDLVEQERNLRFPEVEAKFRVIASDTRTVVIDEGIVNRLETHQHVTWQDIQRASVQIWGYRLDALRVPEITGRPGMYKWHLAYDDFLGYMAGVLVADAFVAGNHEVCII